MDELKYYLECMYSNEKLQYEQNTYKAFQYCSINDEEEESIFLKLIPTLYMLCESGRLKKDLIYLHLLALQNEKVLQKFIDTDAENSTLDTLKPCKMYAYLLHQKHHWILAVIEKYKTLGLHFTKQTVNKFMLLELIKASNSHDIDVIKGILIDLKDRQLNDTFMNYYLNEVADAISVIDVIKALCPECDCSSFDLMFFVIKNGALKTVSEYLDLQQSDKWNQLEILINAYEAKRARSDPSERDIFIAFTAIDKLLIKSSERTTTKTTMQETLNEIQLQLCTLQNPKLLLESMEIIFTLLFLREEHCQINCNVKAFVHDGVKTKLMLQSLKLIIETVKMKDLLRNDVEQYKVLDELYKHVIDAVWRYELLVEIMGTKFLENPIYYMLASPESLIHMCFKKEHFRKAQQVVQIYNLQDNFLSKEIKYSVALKDFRTDMLIISKKNLLQKSPELRHSVVSLTEEFSRTFQPPFKEDFQNQDLPIHISPENLLFMEVFDLAITVPENHEDCLNLMEFAFAQSKIDPNSDYLTFCNRFRIVYNEVASNYKIPAKSVLTSSFFTLDVHSYKKTEEFYDILQNSFGQFMKLLESSNEGCLDWNHDSHKQLLQLNDICEEHTGFQRKNFLLKLFTYLKAFANILYIERDNSAIVSQGRRVPFFEILNHNRALILGKLLFEIKMNPSEYEEYFSNMKLDLMYHIFGNCFPTINLHKQDKLPNDEMYPDNKLYVPDEMMVNYMQKRNWLLAFILNEMYNIGASIVGASEIRIQYLMNYIQLQRIQCLKVVFDSEIITALQNEFNEEKLVNFVRRQIVPEDNVSTPNEGHSDVEAAEEIVEENSKATDWRGLYDILNSLPQNQKDEQEYVALRDFILQGMIKEHCEYNCYKYVYWISDRQLRVETILHCFKYWPLTFCMQAIQAELTSFEPLQENVKETLEQWLKKLEFYKSVSKLVGLSAWNDICRLCEENQEEVLKKVLSTKKLDLLLNYIDACKPDSKVLMHITVNWFLTLFENDTPLTKIQQLLNGLPREHAENVCNNLLKILRKMEHLHFVMSYLLQISEEETQLLKKVQLSLKIFSLFTPQFRDLVWCLITEPLLILEVLVMNMKIEKMTQALDFIKDDIEDTGGVLKRNEIDDMLRLYAEKSLDFRVVVNPNPKLLSTSEVKLLESLDSLGFTVDKRKFMMPLEVPDKSEWIPNNEVLECMCCLVSRFSMFNRRHHCRRCGRVVCYNCSQKRMFVPTYDDILVRVCNDCYEQTNISSASCKTDSSSNKSINQDFWLFTDDSAHNRIVREEFSYEHAPSVSLCLAILKNHSKSTEYPQFLLDQSERMLKLLYTAPSNIPEIDYLLLIRMIKSLAMAAKMLCSESNLDWGVSSTGKIISQADTFTLLIEHGCLHLLPLNVTQEAVLDTATLRRVRDKLMEDEQWETALELSTKSGLDKTGVFAAWGKCCLKAGCLAMARDKFQFCFSRQTYQENIPEPSDSPSTSRLRTSSNLSSSSSKLSERQNQLLDEIILILESNTIKVHEDLVAGPKGQPSSTAICILNKLKKLEEIVEGRYSYEPRSEVRISSSIWVTSTHLQPLFYEECVYYLKTYGSRLSLLKFYMKHNEFKHALKYILDNRLSPEIFTEMYLSCLRDGIVGFLQENLQEVDPTFEKWADYIQNTCKYLDRTNMLHSLYDLQVFLGDHIRAAMSCLIFYRQNVESFTDLDANTPELMKAEEHLKQALEQQQWIEVATVGSESSTETLEERALTHPSIVLNLRPRIIAKHINAIWLQLEITRFIVECEKNGRVKLSILPELVPQSDEDESKVTIPTLFDNSREKLQLAVLLIVCADHIKNGFSLALKIINEYKLKLTKVCCLVGSHLVKNQRYDDISTLMQCIHSTEGSEDAKHNICDEMLSYAVGVLIKENITGSEMEKLIKLMNDKGAKISAYIEAKQLKSAYVLAVKFKRIPDLRRIITEAELLNQPHVKALCLKILNAIPHH